MEKRTDIPVRFLKGIGPKRAVAFERIGVTTIEDLLYYFPRKYIDRTAIIRIKDLEEGKHQSVSAEVIARGERRSWRRRGFGILEVAFSDESGVLRCVWFNQGYLRNYFKPGARVILSAKVERYSGRLQMTNPEFEILENEDSELLNAARIVPVYPLTEGLSQRYLRKLIKSALEGYVAYVKEFLPYDVRSRNKLLNLAKSLLNIHFPEDETMRQSAYERLSFEEFFLFQIPIILRKLRRMAKHGIAHNVKGRLADEFMAKLPFKLTQAQARVIEEISADMQKPQVMQRLLQGDVGSGKTVVAAIASFMALQGGYQVAFMAPTEILARQHFEKISSWLLGLGSNAKNVKLGMLTSGLSEEEKKSVCVRIKESKLNFIIGTHSLLEEKIVFSKLGLVVIDEQHKFGVGQRALLPAKGVNPDVLIMTATPIPRTLAITIYGDLDVSVIDELPSGRGRIETEVLDLKGKGEAYKMVARQVRSGRQAYIIYPVIEDSETLEISGAKKMYEELKKGEFRDYRLGLIHGRLSEKEQEKVMKKFKDGLIDILVSTTVLEVGIDIPNATCMVVDRAERFGLSQLHQLRGRVGRGSADSFCILVSDAESQDAKSRLKAMAKYTDGFRIAEEDLKIRGPGEFFGSRQHGLTELRIADPLKQMRLLKRSREEAQKLLEADPGLNSHQNEGLRDKLLQRFPEYERLAMTG